MLTEIEQLLTGATERQLRYVAARVRHTRMQDACAELGIHRSSSHRWENKARLERAVRLILLERIKALSSGIDFMQHTGETTWNSDSNSQ